MKSMANQIDIKHLEYELRQLLGAAKVCNVLEKHHTGNIVNYVKDSQHVYVRNLYHFLCRECTVRRKSDRVYASHISNPTV